MEKSRKHLIIVAGEASGDMHAACLVQEIKSINPNIRFSGLGGKKMQAAGVELYEDLTNLAVVGFVEVFKHIREFRRLFYLILKKAQETKADAVILVDYPGFNLRLARELKKLGIKVIYYISPQVWAWKESRVTLIKQCTDKMLVFFEFEKEFYARRGLNVDFVGHPLLDSIKVETSRENFLQSIGFSKDKRTIAVLAGSRRKEVEQLLPVMLAASQILYTKNNQIQFLVLKSPTTDKKTVEKFVNQSRLPVKIIDGQTYDGINASDFCMVASGTATLETAILQKPMVVVYKTSFLTWVLAKLFVKIPCIGLVNVVAGRKIVPECVQFDATAEKIAENVRAIFDVPSKMAQVKSDLARVKSSLGAPGASARAAEIISQII
ncbi:MAG TPA: lipid-A-disaccharide synthase [Candidatus Omnitrophota bacterium]|nr:lipid-A-disaccharide synthase [Candidatus Omnitrophota bacterium]HPD84949.1 lipid-A-disaccharide synthase [Candidatus Omnitrophota bacterium]HRZ03807.1 lipid-A-disaccharide synthase [Candidatus Omnitrophota bacterium]